MKDVFGFSLLSHGIILYISVTPLDLPSVSSHQKKSLIFAVDLATELLGPECVTVLLHDLDIFNFGCLKLLLSKILGYGMVFGASVIKIPQILAITRSRSVKGLNYMLTYLELIAPFSYTVTLSYNTLRGNAFSTYGETLFLLIQNLIILFFLNYFPKKVNRTRTIATTLGYTALAALVVMGLIDVEVLWYMQLGTVPLFAVSRIPQIIQNYNSQGTGQLSLITWFLQFAGNMARVFTTVQEVGDFIILLGYLSTGFLNGVIFGQILYYSYFKEYEKLY